MMVNKMDIPAFVGGTPIRDKKHAISFGEPVIEEDEISAVTETLRSKWLEIGPKTERFEEEFKNYIGSDYSIAVSSGTAALHLALLANGIGKGDEVIVTPMTFAATVNVIEYVGATPIFADIKLDSYNIDPEEIAKKITSKTKAIMPVHLYGLPCQMNEIKEIAKKHNILVIDDAAHALGSEYKNNKIGNTGTTTCFSFYPTKNMTTINGGMITTNDKKVAEKARQLRWHGLGLNEIRSSYTVNLGFKYTMPDVSAAMGLCQLKKLDKFIKIKEMYAKIYENGLKDLDVLILPPRGDIDLKNSWHLYAILVKHEKLKITRNELIKALRMENIGTGIHYLAVHLHPYYKNKYNYREGDYPNAEFLSGSEFSISMSPAMNKDDVNDTVMAIRRIIEHFQLTDV